MTNKEKIAGQIIALLGGAENILSLTNCMTRLRAVVRKEDGINEEELKNTEMVLGLVHDRPCSYEIVVGPGNSRQLADSCHNMGIPAAAGADIGADTEDWKANKNALRAGQKNNKVKAFLKMLGDIFIPLIPGIIAAGLCAGFASLITQLVPGYQESSGWHVTYLILTMINVSFMTFITAWAGYRAAECFGATPILGGMLGMLTSLSQIDTLAGVLGLFNEADPLSSVLRTGKGGVLAVIVGVFILAAIEKRIRKKMPASLDIILTPLLTLIICVIPYVLVVMPLFGYVSNGIVWVFSQACMSESVVVRLIVGYVSAALFLPMVAAGMHHGMVALYSVQLQALGFVTLYPALAMAGAGQVGAALALLGKAKRVGHQKLCSVIRGAVPAGFLGIGEPLIYGVTLPMGRPFLTAGLGAGFGGAFVMLTQVASTTWGPSGLVGVLVMTAGKGSPLKSMLYYLIGLVIAYGMSYIITKMVITDQEVAQALGGIPREIEDIKIIEGSEELAPIGGEAIDPVQVSSGEQASAPYPDAAVAEGELIPMAEIPDPTFSSGIMGECFGILPRDGKVYSPVTGTVVGTVETGHAIILRSDEGKNILLHVGIDTVKLEGKAFRHYVKEGEPVTAHQLLMEADLEMIRKAGLSEMIIVVTLEG